MNSEENDENKKKEINNNKETKLETEDNEIALNIEDNIEFEKNRENNLLNTEEQLKKKPSCRCSCALF